MNVVTKAVVMLMLIVGSAMAQTSSQDSDATLNSDVRSSIGEQLQDISVTIVSGTGEGSGVVVLRGDTNYVLTAGHVIAGLRKTREVVDPKTGASKTIIEFDKAKVVQKLYEDGRLVGSLEMEASVVCYSDSDTGEDLAVLRVLKKNFIRNSAKFYLKNTIPPVGTDLYHVGSLRGQFGANSLTTGIVSQVGRVYDDRLYDQSSCTAMSGSSGGGMFLKDTGEYIGMLVRGASVTFNLYIPMRRIRQWTDRMNLSFVIDPSLPIPTKAELDKIPVEDIGSNISNARSTTRPAGEHNND